VSSEPDQPHDHWRRPSTDPADPRNQRADDRYQGPPPTSPPEPGWQPPLMMEIRPPRTLPTLDHYALDEQEERARNITYAVGYGAVAVLLLAVLIKLLL
jgi:hypothetical protein